MQDGKAAARTRKVPSPQGDARKRGHMKANMNVDATDLAIVELLRQNGRATNQQIAEKLGLTATTVSSRIRRMEDSNQLRVVAVSDFAAHGYDLLLRINIDVEGRPATDVAEEIAEFPEVFAVHLATGRHDIDMLVAMPEFSMLDHFLNDCLAKVPGIRAMYPGIFVDILKYQFDVAPIESRE
jgi:DNA-binding Lrp family transcriptional regulator